MYVALTRQEEEAGRSLQLEERLRSHYSVVLEHMEAQLKMVIPREFPVARVPSSHHRVRVLQALRLQDDADKLWLEDVELRNRQQVEALRAFEEKCRRLYDTRLHDYAEKTAQQLAKYEQELLEVRRIGTGDGWWCCSCSLCCPSVRLCVCVRSDLTGPD